MLPLSPPSCNLYCSENAEEVAHGFSVPPTPPLPPPAPSFSGGFDGIISQLFVSERHHRPLPDYLALLRSGNVDSTARQDSIAWILKVHRFFRFRPGTAALAVSYLDRFLSCNTLPRECGGWPWQLLAVACLSVAAKMEEALVPPLLDLQVMDTVSGFVFEPRTIQRMELLLMTALHWRLKAVTPFDFFHHLVGGEGGGSRLFPRACELVLRTLHEVDFLSCLPSAIAGAAIVCAVEEIGDTVGFNVDLSNYDVDGKEAVEECCSLIRKHHLIGTHQIMTPWRPRRRSKMAGVASQPLSSSPVAVLDAAACRSCESHTAPETTTTVVEPPCKRLRRETLRCVDNKKDNNV